MKLKLIITGLFLPLAMLAQKHQDRFNTIDVKHYQFNLTLTDESNVIHGQAVVSIHFKKDAPSIYLDLVNENSGEGMKVTEVKEGDKILRFQHQNDRLNLTVNAKAGQERQFTISYEGVPSTGLIIATNKHGDRTFFGDNWPDRGKNWLPLVDHPSDKATVEWIVTAPSHYTVIGNGEKVSEQAVANTTKTHWRSTVALPTKVMVIGAARFAIEKSGEVDGAEISSWVYPQDEKAGFYDYALATPITQWFADHIGPYPFVKLANVQSKTQFGGMENASNIFYSENSVTGKRNSEGLIAHEVAHQWFGNSASEANWHHVWLSEGFATYFTILYMEDKYGKERAAELRAQDREQIIEFNNRQSVPVVNPAIENYMRLLNANSYQKGGFVLHMLRNEVGDENFWKAIRAYYDRYKLSNALTEDLKNVFEEVSSKELDPFFNQWIYQAGQPVLRAKIGKTKFPTIDLVQLQPGEFVFPLSVRFEYRDGSSEVKTFEINQKQQTLRGTMEKDLKSFTLDPDTQLLFEAKMAGN